MILECSKIAVKLIKTLLPLDIIEMFLLPVLPHQPPSPTMTDTLNI